MLYIFALSLGVENYLFRSLPFSPLQALNLTSVLALGGMALSPWKSLLEFSKHRLLFLILIIYFILSCVRYFWLYQPTHIFFPILRHSAALFLGFIILIFSKRLFKKYSFDEVATAVLATAVPFMVLGLVQKVQGTRVGEYPRITSLFSEPSYYGDYLILFVAPFLISKILMFNRLLPRLKILLSGVFVLWCLNLYSVQSGTSIVKAASLISIFIVLMPIHRTLKLITFLFSLIMLLAILMIENSYTSAIIVYGFEIIDKPEMFFKIHTFYDRIFPLYAALKTFLSPVGFFGLGFGADYYEFYSLYPPETHEAMLYSKPTLSYFNSFASKVILYFGITGIAWYVFQLRKIITLKNPFLRVCFLNVLITTLWGISNLSLPYLWVWMALVDKELLDQGTESPV